MMVSKGYEFILTETFEKDWKSLRLTDDDLSYLQSTLNNNPKEGSLIVGGSGLRKIRIAFPNRGKSGSARVCYVDLLAYDKIYLIKAYAKNEQANLSQSDLNNISKNINILKQSLK